MNTDKTRKRILIVDDEEIHRMGLRDRLEASGYEIDSASSGEEALKLVEANSYDLITLDLLMPKPNGFEVFRQLKERSVASKTCRSSASVCRATPSQLPWSSYFKKLNG